MTLYKYLHPARVEVLENLQVRFTQPGALNDPFELKPRFETLISQAELLASMPKEPVDLRSMIELAYSLLPPESKTTISLEFATQKLEEFMASDEARQATASALRAALDSMTDAAQPARESIFDALNRNVGILSLSEICDNELMWSHYADSHRGFVIGFDETHNFFNRRRTENDEFYFVRKVQYSDDPSASMSNVDGDALLTSKGTKWEYEREWRMLLPLRDSTKSITIDGDEIHLFSFPPEAVSRIILGAKASSVTQQNILKAIKSKERLSNIRVERATLDDLRRSIVITANSAD